MAWFADIIGGVLILAGAFFFVVGAVGIYRMPDVFARMHAAGISDTVGAGLLILGMMFLAGFTFVSAKLAIIFGIIFFTSPIATHALAQAALHEGLEPVGVGKEVLIGPGAHAEPDNAGKSKSKSSSAATKKPARKSTSSSARKTKRRTTKKKTSQSKRRTRS